MSAKGDHTDYLRFCRRILRAASRRVGSADPEDLTELLALSREIDGVIQGAVTGLRETGFSWAQIGEAAGVTRQAAFQRWGVKAAFTLGDRTEPELAAVLDREREDRVTSLTLERFTREPAARVG